jgi:glycosyltransferase involved in cell wall biosynthesis
VPENAPPTVLQVLPALGAGGAERSAVDVAIAAKRAGWTSLIASAGGRLVDEVTAAGVEHLTLPLDTKNPLRMGRNVGRLQEIIRTRRVDIVHARSRAPAWSAWTATRRAGRVFVTTFHGQYDAARVWSRAYNRVMARGDKVIAVSDFIVEHVKRTYGLEAARIVMIHRGLDPAVFDPAAVGAARVGRLARDWDLPDDRPIVMLPGRLTRLKGQLVLIEAVARLERKNLLVLLIGGDPGRSSYRAELEQRVAALGLGQVIRFTGDCDDMPAAYLASDLVISASTKPESFGRVAVEAQAMGRPVIATDHGGARETVVEGTSGWLVPPGDAARLAEALERALEADLVHQKGFADQARAHVAAKFSLEAMCRKTLEVYDSLLPKP